MHIGFIREADRLQVSHQQVLALKEGSISELQRAGAQVRSYRLLGTHVRTCFEGNGCSGHVISLACCLDCSQVRSELDLVKAELTAANQANEQLQLSLTSETATKLELVQYANYVTPTVRGSE